MNRLLGSLLLLLMFPLSWNAGPAVVPAVLAQEVERDVPFVPTPEEVVTEMLRMAAVSDDDLLYDLGSGDGRIVIAAAKEMGARGIGIDIDPERIRESQINAERAGVTGKVEFREMNLFDVDLREATVVTMYLLPDVNLRLRPKLLEELRPGTRIVSHDFDMGEWQPDATARVRSHTVYYWLIPANTAGTWTLNAGEEQAQLELTQDFQQVEGALQIGDNRLPLREATLSGNRLQFVVEREINGRKVAQRFDGRIEGDRMTGTLENEGENGEWQAQRDPQTKKPIDSGIRL